MSTVSVPPNDAHFHGNRPGMPDIVLKILLVICPLDRARSEASRNPDASPEFDRCRSMLNEIRDACSSSSENVFSATVDVTYKVNALISAMERMMIALALESAPYARLQQCINLMDEVDLILETLAVCNLPAARTAPEIL